MRLGRMLSVGEVVEQPAAGEPASARPEAAPAEPVRLAASAAPADDGRALVPAVTGAGRRPR